MAYSKTIDSAISNDLPRFGKRWVWLRIFSMLFVKRGNWGALMLTRMIGHFRAQKKPRAVAWATGKLRRDFGCFVHPDASIGANLHLPHPNGIVIGSGTRIGANCTIFQQVTFGAAQTGDGFGDKYPHVGDDVTIFAGAKLIGAITIGDGAVIGANAVVLCDVPDGYRAVGVPAKVSPRKPRLPVGAADKGPITVQETLASG